MYGNPIRNIMAQTILNRGVARRIRPYSAGSYPKGHRHPIALEVLSERGYDTSDLRSKSWDKFAPPHGCLAIPPYRAMNNGPRGVLSA